MATQHHSDEIQQIVGKLPPWLVRWGLSILFLIFGGIFLGSFFIRSPEMIQDRIILTTNRPPVNVTASVCGMVDTLLYPEETTVSADAPIAVLHSTSDFRSIYALEQYLTHCADRHCRQHIEMDSTFRLSDEIRNVWTVFRSLVRENGNVPQTGNHLPYRDELIALIRQWKETYLLIAPVSGKLIWLNTGWVNTGGVVAAILPEDTVCPEIQGVMSIGKTSYRKIVPGQRVEVILAGTNSTDNEILKGTVRATTPLIEQEGYRVTVSFPSGTGLPYRRLFTHSRFVIGWAKIIVEEQNLSDKLWEIRE